MKFDTIKIRGIEFEINIDKDGKFYAEVDGSMVRAGTLDALKRKLNGATRKQVSIPFVYWDNDGWDNRPGKLVHAVCVGIHVGNDNLLVKIGKEPTTQLRGYRGSDHYFDPKDADELKRLQDARALANKALEQFRERKCIDVKALVIAAIGGKEEE